MWLGCKRLGTDFFFNVPDGYKEELMATKTQGCGWRVIDGEVVGRVANACWFTNIPHTKRNAPLDLYKKYSAEEYPSYDNYDAIEVPRVSEIPMDYEVEKIVIEEELNKLKEQGFIIEIIEEY